MSTRTWLLLFGVALGGCVSEADDDDSATPEPTPAAVPEAIIAADVRGVVGEAVSLDGLASSDAVSWTWDFGDGTTTGPLDSGEVSHTWEAPGHYLVALEVRGADGRPDTTTARATITWPRSQVRSTRANLLDLDWDEDAILAVATDFDAVAVYRPADQDVVAWYPTCAGPRTLSHSRSTANPNALFVACPDDDAVEVWDTASQVLVGRVDLPRGSRPWSVVAPTNGEAGWVALQATGQVVEVIAPLNQAPTLGRTIDVLPDPRGLALHGETLLVSRHRSPDEQGEWVTVDVQTGSVSEHSLFRHPGPDSDTSNRGVPSFLQQITLSPDGRSAWFPSLQANVERGLWRDGLPLTHETTSRAIISSVAVTADEVAWQGLDAPYDERDRGIFDDRDLAESISFSPDGDWAYVGFLGGESITILDAYTLQASGNVPGLVGGAQGVLTGPEGERIYSVSAVSRRLTQISLVSGALPEVEHVQPLQPPGVPDPLTAEEYAGRLIFQQAVDPRMTKDGYLSCATCHLDGDDDGRTWDFTDRGEGLRNTVSLLGKAGGHGPIHWSGNFDEVQDFENDIRGPQAGAGYLDDADWEATQATLGDPKAGLSADLDALAAYVGSLDRFLPSPHRGADGLSDAALAGKQIFEDPLVGCADCHPAPLFTDSQWLAPGQPLLQDVGTLTDASGDRLGAELFGIDTPTLLGLPGSGPYLHDGSAPTLRAVLVDRNPADEHGVTSHLSDEQLDQLVQYLLELETP